MVGCSTTAVGRAIPVVGLRHVVEVLRREERELLVAVDVDHRSVAEGTLESDAHRPVKVVTGTPSRLIGEVVDEYPDVDLVVPFVHEHPAHATIGAAQRDSELELADVSLAKPERATDLLRVRIGAGEPCRANFVVPFLSFVPVGVHRTSVTLNS